MKRLMHILLPAVILLTGCLKEKSLEHGTGGSGGNGGGGNTGTDYVLKCKIANIAKTFNVGLTATKQDAGGGITVYTIAGKANSNATDLESFILSINSSVPLSAKTYKVDDPSTEYTMIGVYNANSQTLLIGSGTGDTSPDPFQITVTSVTATEIAGTFKGTFFEEDATNPTPPTNPPTRAISEGEFRVKFQ